MNPIRVEVESAKGHQSLTIEPAARQWRISELLRRKHLPLNTRCGQRGLCDGCVVELVSGQLIHHTTGETLTAPASVRGCEYRLPHGGDVALRIPPRSLLAYEPQVVSDFKTKVPHAHDPVWQQIKVATAGNLCEAVAIATKHRRPVKMSPSVAGRNWGPSAFVTLEYRDDHWLITDVADQPDPLPVGVAVDIGTTTVALLLADLRDGRVLGGSANFNRQIHLGDDVLTRINLCITDPAGLQQLHDLIVKETIAPLLAEALQKANLPATSVRCMTIAANTTMLHLFAGVHPGSMGIAPFTPEFLEHRVVRLTDFDFPIHLLPGAAAYVGADLTAGSLATGLMYDEGPSLLVDVGTNGEIVLKRGEHLCGCATAAGPAFEGAGLTNGVRATDGAIAHIRLSADPLQVETERIGEHAPLGLCGTAYIDFLAAGCEIGLLTHHGRLDRNAVNDVHGRIIPWKDYGLALRIATGPGKTDIVITELDIANLLQAKAAVAAGILTLLERTGLKPAQIKKLYLAGGFGLHLDREHAIGCGLLPGFSVEQIEVVGNSSLAGAYLSLLDCGALDEVARAARTMEVIELNLDPGFENRFIEQLSLPATAT